MPKVIISFEIPLLIQLLYNSPIVFTDVAANIVSFNLRCVYTLEVANFEEYLIQT